MNPSYLTPLQRFRLLAQIEAQLQSGDDLADALAGTGLTAEAYARLQAGATGPRGEPGPPSGNGPRGAVRSLPDPAEARAEGCAMRLLVVEDNPKMAQTLQRGLGEQGYSVDVTHSGHDGEHLAASESYAAIILDVMLPDQDGLLVARNLRRRGVQTPILMLTALGTTPDKIGGLDAGADDYLVKPFDFDELLARVRALLRRGQAQEASVLRFEDIEIDLLRREVRRSGEKVRLTGKELALLEYLVRHPNRVLTRTAIGEQVWDMNFEPESNVIDVYMSTLRRKIDRPFGRPLIHTVIGSGYMLSQDPPDQ